MPIVFYCVIRYNNTILGEDTPILSAPWVVQNLSPFLERDPRTLLQAQPRPLKTSPWGKNHARMGLYGLALWLPKLFEGGVWFPGRRPPRVRLCATSAHTHAQAYRPELSPAVQKTPRFCAFSGLFFSCVRPPHTHDGISRTGTHTTRPPSGIFSVISRACGVAHSLPALFRLPPACLV